MADTIKIPNKGNVKIVAHRGLSGLEMENTNTAFVAAGNRSYFGIETDIRNTLDGKFVLFHDDNTSRIAGGYTVKIPETPYDLVRSVQLDPNRTDYRVADPKEYFAICKHYDKVAVFEIKNAPSREEVAEICKIVEKSGHLDKTVFIAFNFDALVYVREIFPDSVCQFLTWDASDENLIPRLVEHRFDLDIGFPAITKELVDKCHANGIEVNCWTVNTIEDAERVIDCGVDYITTNILE
ncbi:MAG: hypothetical protein J6B93_01550 [Clostridia bacterium]|nr:hypothetical protein [Clostridia bacterium]